jgi:arylsulfatase A-like enzyme
VPTLLALLGLAKEDHFVGRDILRMAPDEGRALLSTYQNLGGGNLKKICKGFFWRGAAHACVR